MNKHDLTNLQKFIDGVKKTGFVLEYKIGQILKKNGWTVMSNKYYEDDFTGEVREIDIIAYKASKIENPYAYVHTALIISCKKSSENIWALFCREADSQDPNINWLPVHYWSNLEEINFQCKKEIAANRYQKFIQDKGKTTFFKVPDYEIFAFQELNKNSGLPGNDKPIYDSIKTTIKALTYEKNNLAQDQSRAPVFFQFNLLSVLETELRNFIFSEGEIVQRPIQLANYVTRYIVERKEIDASLLFVTADAFESTLAQYDNLHALNVIWFQEQYESFYKNALEDDEKVKLFLSKFRSEFLKLAENYLLKKHNCEVKFEDIFVSMPNWRKEALVSFDLTEEEVDRFRRDENIISVIKQVLRQTYKYHGNVFIEDLELSF